MNESIELTEGIKESLEAYHKLWTILKDCYVEQEQGGMLEKSLPEDSKEFDKYRDFIYPKVA